MSPQRTATRVEWTPGRLGWRERGNREGLAPKTAADWDLVLGEAVDYYPLPITLNGRPLERRDVLVGAMQVSAHRGNGSSSRLASSPSGPTFAGRVPREPTSTGPSRGVRLRRAGGRRVRGCGPHSGSGPAARGIPGPARVSFLRDKAEPPARQCSIAGIDCCRVPRRQENDRGSLRCLRTRTLDAPKERDMFSGPQDGKARSGESRPRVEPLLYRPAEAAEVLRVSPSKLHELMNSGEISWMRLGGVRRVSVEALQRLAGEPHPRAPQMGPLFYRAAEAADALRVSRSKVYELMNRGEIPWVQVGRVRRVPVEALRQLIRARVADRTGRGRR